jgi:hypothetical protein
MSGLRCDCCSEYVVPFGGEDICQCGGRCPVCQACPDDVHAEHCQYGIDEYVDENDPPWRGVHF